MTVPDTGPPVPEPLGQLVAGRTTRAVWVNEHAVTTWSIDGGAEYLKAGTSGIEFDGPAEAERMRWLGERFPTAEVLGCGATSRLTWLHTRGLPGAGACTPGWLSRPERLVPALGRALRTLHELPTRECPWTWSVADRLGDTPPPGPVPELDLVVCHGDACLPNTVIADDGRWSGLIDLGQLGLADRWADLAVGLWSLQHNLGPGWEDSYQRAYGIEDDPWKRRYYTAVKELSEQ